MKLGARRDKAQLMLDELGPVAESYRALLDRRQALEDAQRRLAELRAAKAEAEAQLAPGEVLDLSLKAEAAELRASGVPVTQAPAGGMSDEDCVARMTACVAPVRVPARWGAQARDRVAAERFTPGAGAQGRKAAASAAQL